MKFSARSSTNLNFSDAIRLKLLTDYRVEIIGVDDPLYREYAEQGVFVTLDGKTVTDARTLASHIAVAKAIKKYDLRRIITFHGRVARASEFAARLIPAAHGHNLCPRMPLINRNKLGPKTQPHHRNFHR